MASRLPRHTETSIYRRDTRIATSYDAVVAGCADVLDELIALQHTLMTQNERVVATVAAEKQSIPVWEGRKRKRDADGEEMNEREGAVPSCEAYWKHIDAMHQTFR